MPTLKGLLFNQYAAEGLSLLVEELQSKYTAKKGRRFNHNNVTYEISRHSLNQGTIEYEISSKIPEDEIKSPKEMQAYFQQIKKILSKGKLKPESVEMENIVWDSKKETEKKRDYVKLLYKRNLFWSLIQPFYMTAITCSVNILLPSFFVTLNDIKLLLANFFNNSSGKRKGSKKGIKV